MPLTGLIAAPHTPFHADGSLNPNAIPEQAEHLIFTGVSGVFVCGTTGECGSLSNAERMTIVEHWVKASAGRFPVMVHVGHSVLGECQLLAKHAAASGATAIAALLPYYHPPSGTPEVVRYFAAIAAAAPALPFYVYDIPGITSPMPTAEVMTTLAEIAPNFAGVKYSNPDLVTLQECLVVRGGKLDVLFGIDEMLLAAVALGVHGAVGSTYNFAAPLYRRMLLAVAADDWDTARQFQRTSVRIVRVLDRFGGLAAGKAIMGFLGIDCGPVRLPLRTVVDRDGLRTALNAIGFFDEIL